MESLLIPGILVGATVLCWRILRHSYDWDWLYIIVGVLMVGSLFCCPVIWASSKNAAIEAQSYYANIVQPHVIEEHQDYVIVGTEIAPAIWQAGASNLPEYNAYLRSTRYWDSIPIIGSVVYPPPKELKYVRVQNKEG